VGRILKRIFITLGVALVLVALLLLRLLNAGGAFDRIAYHALAGCAPQPLPGSAEDLEVDHATGIAYLSVLDRRAARTGADVAGTVLALDLSRSGAPPLPAIADAPPGFRPHGLSLWARGDGPRRLFVVNHPRDAQEHEQQTIEVFEQAADRLFHHVRTVRDPLFVHPNDLAAVGPEQFYVANDSGAHSGFTRLLEFLLRPGWSDVVYYDGAHASVAVSGRAMANGVAASADGLRLYVAETAARQVLIFDRDTENGSLYWSGLVELPGGPDNIDLAEDGSLWVAAHPNLWALLRYLFAAKPAPTMILRMTAPVSGFNKPQRIYVNDGTEISAASVGVAYRGRLVIGSVMDRKLLICPLPPVSGSN
jgi:arylesterase/paraoxonase